MADGGAVVAPSIGEPPGGTEPDQASPSSLQPFVHQVGGHSNMFTYEGNTVCKPLFQNEYNFYRTMPEEIRQFAPKCKGSFDVLFTRDDDNQVHITIMSPVRRLDQDNHLDTNGYKPCPQLQQHEGETKRSSAVISNNNFVKNPWSERCHLRMLKNLSPETEQPRKYIILENAVQGFKKPCILDVKMGTRQQGLDDNDFKQRLKIGRCLSSTTCTHGFRIGGMQVHQMDSGEFYRCNKYATAVIDKDNIHEWFYKYLHNGVRLRLELIEPLVKKLQALLVALGRRNDIRIFSGSLMVIYEGEESEDVLRSSGDEAFSKTVGGIDKSGEDTKRPGRNFTERIKVDIKLIDFAHSFHKDSRPDFKFVGPDIGFLFGLESLIKVFQNVKERYS